MSEFIKSVAFNEKEGAKCLFSINQKGEAFDGEGKSISDEQLGKLMRQWVVEEYMRSQVSMGCHVGEDDES